MSEKAVRDRGAAEAMLAEIPDNQAMTGADLKEILLHLVDNLRPNVDALKAERDELLAALRNIVRAVDVTDDASQGVFILAQVHGSPYKGPTHSDALNAARAVISRATGYPSEQHQETQG